MFLTFMIKLSIHLLIPFHNLHSSFIVLFYTYLSFYSTFYPFFLQKYMRLWGIVLYGDPPPIWGKATSFPCGHYYALTQMQFAACDAKKGELRIQHPVSVNAAYWRIPFLSLWRSFCVHISLILSLALLYFDLSLFESHFT